eukprot:CAMPEP_0116033002 /NCGR_PEP_ID=MMETSP0321-20121206/18648_1 /TAXON_ID=163516 /ORGANISM="Leptocylindrus danicus var. danicus, Strain B650" /LENGTH=127 /DNA_ID=CAMNT_0003508831 /DNA_START=70 /DNA_END=453 /DNA_ORIENTATION=+
MKTFLSALLISIPVASAWTLASTRDRRLTNTRLRESLDDDSDCFTWQDVYEFDAPLSHCYEQMFVASDWIKSMPCGANLEDCDMPEPMKIPGTHDGHAMIKTDVMEFLGLKRAKSLEKEEVRRLRDQ